MALPPLIAILGRPNVGKSTLFNRLLGNREAIVEDRPGVTRDRHYGRGTHGRFHFRLVDTGGIVFRDDHPLGAAIQKQALFALEEADALIYTMDGLEGYNPIDQDVIDFVRASGKPAVFVVNKIDGVNAEARLADFYQHGVSPLIGISAAHGRNINEVLTPFLPLMTEEAEETLDVPIRFTEEAGEDARKWIARRQMAPARVAIVGRPNVGKSTLVNRILGSERLVTSPIPGTTRDAIDTLVHWGGKDYHLIDTAGLRKKGKVAEASELYAQIRTEQAIINSEISIVLLSAEDGLTDGDLRIIREVIDKRRGLILAWNKWDLLKGGQTEGKAKGFAEIREKYPFLAFAPMSSCSGLTGLHIQKLFTQIDLVRQWYYERIPTAKLNAIIGPLMAMTPPPRLKNYPVRVFYTTQIQVAPSVFVMFANRPEGISMQYRQFISRKIRETYPFIGVPFSIRVQSKHEGRDEEG